MVEENRRRLKIVMETDLELAKKILPKMYFLFYKTKVNSLLKIISSRLKEYETDDSKKNKRIFVQEGTKEEMEREKKKLEDFLFSNANKLEDSDEIKTMKNDRLIRIIQTKLKKTTKTLRNKAINMALRTDSVLEFFSRVGIAISWEVY